MCLLFVIRFRFSRRLKSDAIFLFLYCKDKQKKGLLQGKNSDDTISQNYINMKTYHFSPITQPFLLEFCHTIHNFANRKVFFVKKPNQTTKKSVIMETHKTKYLAPEVELLDMLVEAGFGNSLQDPFEEDPMEW